MSRFYKVVKKQRGGTVEDAEVLSSDSSNFRVEIEDEIDDPVALAATHINMRAVSNVAFTIGKPRASSILSSCIRMHVIGSVNKIVKTEWSGPKSRVLFGYGNAYHYWVQNTGDIFQDRRVGWWFCTACGSHEYFGNPPAHKCEKCGALPLAFIYYEHHMDLEGEFPVSGHPDLFLDIQKLFLRVMELKSINGKDFDKLHAPQALHVEQCQTYMWGCSIDPMLPGKVDPDIGYILYISKQYKTSELPFKMFKVKSSPVILGLITDRAKSYKIGVDNYPDQLPEPDRTCEVSDFTNYKAKQCPCRKICIQYAF